MTPKEELIKSADEAERQAQRLEFERFDRRSERDAAKALRWLARRNVELASQRPK